LSLINKDVRAAVGLAQNYFNNLQDMLGSFQNLLLEEVELSDKKQFWLITLGFDYQDVYSCEKVGSIRFTIIQLIAKLLQFPDIQKCLMF
ncbi:MAG: hypothetical protein ACKPFF_11465, partial [Planktothrix sp.]